jgi:Fe2+ or Zn2+ uptake regulation protein
MSIRRNTVQRNIILDALRKLATHPTTDEVFAAIHDDHPTISKSTVYRNLRLLAESGVIRQVFLPDGRERYDSRVDRHHHFRCRKCGVIMDVDVGSREVIDYSFCEKYGLQVDGYDMVFNGICSKCAKEQGHAKATLNGKEGKDE